MEEAAAPRCRREGRWEDRELQMRSGAFARMVSRVARVLRRRRVAAVGGRLVW